jgi:hypothetical protein
MKQVNDNVAAQWQEMVAARLAHMDKESGKARDVSDICRAELRAISL